MLPLYLYARVRLLLCATAHETSGAASTRSSLRPQFSRGPNENANLGRIPPRESGPMPHAVEILNQKALPCMNDHTQLGVFDLDHGCRSAILAEGLRPAACRGMLDAMFEASSHLRIGRHV